MKGIWSICQMFVSSNVKAFNVSTVSYTILVVFMTSEYNKKLYDIKMKFWAWQPPRKHYFHDLDNQSRENDDNNVKRIEHRKQMLF